MAAFVSDSEFVVAERGAVRHFAIGLGKLRHIRSDLCGILNEGHIKKRGFL